MERECSQEPAIELYSQIDASRHNCNTVLSPRMPRCCKCCLPIRSSGQNCQAFLRCHACCKPCHLIVLHLFIMIIFGESKVYDAFNRSVQVQIISLVSVSDTFSIRSSLTMKKFTLVREQEILYLNTCQNCLFVEEGYYLSYNLLCLQCKVVFESTSVKLLQ